MDLSIIRWVSEQMHNPFLDWLMPLITSLGNNGSIWFVFCAILIIFKHTRRWGLMCIVSLMLATLIGEFTIKPIIARARPFTHLPDLLLLIPPPSSYSFPSGHTASSFAAATVIRFMGKKRGRWALALAALIGFSRIYLSAHYLTDVLAGIVLGVACAFLSKWIFDKLWNTGEIL